MIRNLPLRSPLRLCAALLCPLLAWLSLGAWAADVVGVRLYAASDYTRLVLDLSGPVSHELSVLENPHRVVIDLRGTRLQASHLPDAEGFVKLIRSGVPARDTLRVVLDTALPVKPRSFALQPEGAHGDRLVVDLVAPDARSEPRPVRTAMAPQRDIVVAISPGHGGRDPGAIGRSGTREKDVVLAISRRLKAHLDAVEGMRGVLVRNDDRLVGHRDRMRIAREHKADLFVAIHADAFPDVRAHGSTVYILSERGASSEAARWLADKHNATDLIGGVTLDDKDDVLASVLLDLSQSASLGASMTAAEKVIAELGKVGRVRKKTVQQAGFLVLKSPDIPSMLVETAFISNPQEEARLKKPRHQDRWGEAIAKGIVAYFADNPPPGTLMAERQRVERPDDLEYVIARGDTLSDIADRFNVPLRRLRTVNRLHGDRIRVGQILKIPASRG